MDSDLDSDLEPVAEPEPVAELEPVRMPLMKTEKKTEMEAERR